MRQRIINMLKTNPIVRRCHTYIANKVPFVSNLVSLYRYSNWLKRYKITLQDNEPYYHKFDELHRMVLQQVNNNDLKKPIIIMTTYNDHDVIDAIIRENDRLGYEQVIIDNWSSDGTWKIIEKLKGELHSILDIKHFPEEGPTNDYQWKLMLNLKAKIALNFKGRWIIHQDSDEITIPPFYNHEIKYILNAIKTMGYNTVSLRMLDFIPIDNSFTIGNPINHFEHYRISPIISYGLQNKIWLQGDEEVDLSCMGGHDVEFQGKNIFPIRLPRFHYSIRSIDHAKSKYSPKRLERSESERTELGWHTHVEIKISEKIIYSKEELIKYDFNDLYSEKFHWFIYNG